MNQKSKIQNPRSKISHRSFTLIELLLVISIIAILLGVIVPTYFGVRERARTARAKSTVKHLELAFREYFNYYRTWPAGPGEHKIKEDLFDIMQGENVGGKNKAGLAFMEFERIPKPSGISITDQEWYRAAWDPWYHDRLEPYRVMFDHTFKNKITHPDAGDIYRSVIVWSIGPPGGELIGSWE